MNVRDALDAARARIAELEAERDRALAEAEHSAHFAKAEADARDKAEAEVDRLKIANVELAIKLGIRRAKLEAERDRLKAALTDLSDAERNYRMIHDLDGDGHIDVGRAWDNMRRAGDRARAALSDPSGEKKP